MSVKTLLIVFDRTRTGVLGDHVSLGIYSSVFKPRASKFGTQLKIGKIYYRKQHST